MGNGETALFARVPSRIAPPNASSDDVDLVSWVPFARNEVVQGVQDLTSMIAEGLKLAFLGLSHLQHQIDRRWQHHPCGPQALPTTVPIKKTSTLLICDHLGVLAACPVRSIFLILSRNTCEPRPVAHRLGRSRTLAHPSSEHDCFSTCFGSSGAPADIRQSRRR